jgi:hypothetical protein
VNGLRSTKPAHPGTHMSMLVRRPRQGASPHVFPGVIAVRTEEGGVEWHHYTGTCSPAVDVERHPSVTEASQLPMRC